MRGHSFEYLIFFVLLILAAISLGAAAIISGVDDRGALQQGRVAQVA